MPEIKYTGAPTVTPEEARRTAAVPEIHEQYPEVRLTRAKADALGITGGAVGQLGNSMETVGRSINSLGNAIEGAGDKMWNTAVALKQVEAETKVNNLNIKVSQDLIKRDEEFLTKSGEAANSEALAVKLQGDEKLRQSAKAQLTTDYERKLFDAQTTHTFILSARQSARHAGTETKNQHIHSLEAQLSIIQNQAAGAKEDSDFNTLMGRSRGIFYDQLRYATGMDQAQLDNAFRIYWTKALVGRAQRMSDDGDPGTALKMLEDNKDKIAETDEKIYTKAHEQIEAKANRDGARVIGDKANANMDAPINEKVKIARDEAERARPGDLEFRDMTIERTRTVDAIHHREQADLRERAHETVSTASHGRNPVTQGKKPNTEEDLMAIPGVKEQWPYLSDAQKEATYKILQANARGEYPDTPETKSVFRDVEGSMIEDREAWIDKMKRDPAFIDKLEIPERYRDQLYNRYLAILAEGVSDKDTAVGRAYSHLKQNGSITDVMERNATFRHTIRSYLDEVLKEKKAQAPNKPLKPQDYDDAWSEIAGRMDPNWLQRTFHIDPEERWRSYGTPDRAFKNDMRKINPAMSEAEMQRNWIRAKRLEELKKHTQKPASTPNVTIVPTKPSTSVEE